MRHLLIGISVAAMLGAPLAAMAQTKDQPGHSESAPGQRATKPGEAKQHAPGQQERRMSKDKQPGAKEYAPGHQPSNRIRAAATIRN
jgi:Ni/Co efflux regulator RcnB